MKKLFISTMMALACIGANAQIETTPLKTLGRYLYGIDEQFLYDAGTQYVVSVEWGGSDGKTAGTMRVYDNEFNLKKTITPESVPSNLDVHVLNENSADYTIYLTQTLFNDDEKFEYLIEPGSGTYATELKVVSEDGTVLQTLKFPAGVEVYRGDGIGLFVMGSNKYLRIGESVDENGNEYMNLYKINKDAKDPSKVSIATAPMRVSVSPRMASRNQDINVVAEGNGVREVIVTNAAGQVVYSTKVAAGENNVRISSRRLSSGLNVVSVKGADGKEENCKVIVKK